MNYGYARVSTTKQMKDGNSIEDQTRQLIESGVKEQNILVDSYTGTKADRPNFSKLLNQLKEGDTLTVCKIDRFARSVLDGITIITDLIEKGITVKVLNMGIAVDNKPVNKAMVTMLLMFAELERDLIVERTQTGKAIAREHGIRVDGRPEVYNHNQKEHALELLESGYTYTEVERMTGLSKSTLIRAKKKNIATQGVE